MVQADHLATNKAIHAEQQRLLGQNLNEEQCQQCDELVHKFQLPVI